MSIINESGIKGYRNKTRLVALSLSESLRNFKTESKTFKKKIFLSHKHDESEILDGAISFLKKEGVDVYVDWLDDGMPKITSGVTAAKIKEKIEENDKFIFLATEGAINSKWCNWELGLGDAAKYINNIAILPVRRDNSVFSGAEYLSIYPYIDYEDGSGKYSRGGSITAGYYVKYPSVNGTCHLYKLSDWLSR
jgi:hypothetical protein